MIASRAAFAAPAPTLFASARGVRAGALLPVQRGLLGARGRRAGPGAGAACGAAMGGGDAPSRRSALAQMLLLLGAVGLELGGAAQPALADRSYTTMRTAFQSYVPRIKAGIADYETNVKKLVDSGDWAALAEALGPKSKAQKLAYVNRYSSGVVGEVVELKGILKIFASSITASDSESGTTQKLYQILMKYAEFNEKLLDAAAAQDKVSAVKAHAAANYALRLFIDTINPEIPRSVGKIELGPSPVSLPAPAAPAATAAAE